MNRFTVKFAFLQGFYWVSSCFVYAFAERFLTAYGFGVQQVGFVMASANAAALLLQPLPPMAICLHAVLPAQEACPGRTS